MISCTADFDPLCVSFADVPLRFKENSELVPCKRASFCCCEMAAACFVPEADCAIKLPEIRSIPIIVPIIRNEFVVFFLIIFIFMNGYHLILTSRNKIGRASCRETFYIMPTKQTV